MSKIGWGAARLYHPSSLTHRVPVRKLPPRKLTDPVKIACEGLRWFAVCTASTRERHVADEINADGAKFFQAYCPMGRKTISWRGGRPVTKKIVREFPVFSRYIFVAQLANLPVGRFLSEHIIAVLRDSTGPLQIAATAIANINAREMAGEWDFAKFRPERSAFKPGQAIRIAKGPFALFPATVDAVESETRLRVLVAMFGRSSATSVDLNDVELVA